MMLGVLRLAVALNDRNVRPLRARVLREAQQQRQDWEDAEFHRFTSLPCARATCTAKRFSVFFGLIGRLCQPHQHSATIGGSQL